MNSGDTSLQHFEPFNGDSILHAEVARLIGKWGVRVAVETGTFLGETTWALSLLCDEVHTIEIESERLDKALCKFRGRGVAHARPWNVHFHLGSSAKVLGELRQPLSGRRTLYYLDAHWHDYWPLRDELDAIACIPGPPPVIVIHDFRVPERPELGFDSYHGQALDEAYVSDHLQRLYHGMFTSHHHCVAMGARRGVLFVEPTY